MNVWEACKTLPDIGVAQVTFDGVVVDCNEYLPDLLRMHRDVVIGSSVISSLTSAGDRDRMRSRFNQLAPGDTNAVSLRSQILLSTGGVEEVQINLTAIEGHADYLLYWVFHRGDQDKLLEQIAHLQQVLTVIIDSMESGQLRLPEINFNVHQRNSGEMTIDQGQHANADHGGVASNSRDTPITWTVVIAAGLLGATIISVVALWVGGAAKIESDGQGGGSVEINSTDEKSP